MLRLKFYPKITTVESIGNKMSFAFLYQYAEDWNYSKIIIFANNYLNLIPVTQNIRCYITSQLLQFFSRLTMERTIDELFFFQLFNYYNLLTLIFMGRNISYCNWILFHLILKNYETHRKFLIYS